MRLFAASYTAEWSLRTCGEPLGIRLLHAPVPPNPLALVSTQTSFKRGSPAAASSDNPANRMIRFDEGSYTEVDPLRNKGYVKPLGPNSVQLGLAAAIRAKKLLANSTILEINLACFIIFYFLTCFV